MRTCALASNRARLIEMLATTAFVPSGAEQDLAFLFDL